ITGFIRGATADSTHNYAVKLVIEEGPSGRTIEGTAGRSRVELRLTSEVLDGVIAPLPPEPGFVFSSTLPLFERRFTLHAEGDDLVGTSALADAAAYPLRVAGR